MAFRDKEKFEKATERWYRLHEQGRYSVPPNVGRLAVICSTMLYHGYEGQEVVEAEIANLRKEAADYKAHAELNGIEAVVFDSATFADLREVLRDETFSSVATVGHGALPYLYLAGGGHLVDSWRFEDISETTPLPVNDRFDWFDVAMEATHLKLGTFEQRQCGHAIYDLSVPMGVFAMADHRFVYAPTNATFQPKSLLDPVENEKIESVAFGDQITYDEIVSFYGKLTEAQVDSEALANLADDIVRQAASSTAIKVEPYSVAANALTGIISSCTTTISRFRYRRQ